MGRHAISVALVGLLLAACGSGGFGGDDDDAGTDLDSDVDTDVDTDADTDTDTDTDTGTGSGTGGDSLPCETSNFDDTTGFYDFLMEQRRAYGGSDGIHARHDRWKGHPWEGEYHTNTTFPDVFELDDGLAARALADAERLASGGAPEGREAPGASPGQRSFWIADINTADWRISFAEEPGDWEKGGGFGGSDLAFALHNSNGTARLGFHYHDFGGDGPAIASMGIAAACAGETTWWVMQMGP